MISSPARSRAVLFTALFLGNLLCYLIGIGVVPVDETTNAVWPAAAFAVAAVILYRRTGVAAVFASTLVGNIVHFVVLRHGGFLALLPSALAIAAGNALEPWIAAWWTERFCGGAATVFRRAASYFLWVLGLVVATVVGAVIGVATFLIDGTVAPPAALEVFLTWWWGGLVSILVFAPLWLVWHRPPREALRGWRLLEAVASFALLVLACGALAGYFIPTLAKGFPGALLVIPIVLWIGFRFRAHGVTAALFVVTVIAVAGTLRGFVAFPGEIRMLSLLYLQLFIGVVAVVGIGFIALLDERDDQMASVAALNVTLEQKVAARTEQLERINEELTDAVRIVAHDVRGPVAGIRAMARQMRTTERLWRSTEGPEYLAEIERTSSSAVDMMVRLLDLQRASDRAAGLMPEPADVGGLITEICDRLRPAAAAKGIALRTVVPAAGSRHDVDAEAVESIAANLIGNAIKFLPPGGAVDVSLAETQNRMLLVVRDNGPGIAADEIPRLFEKFERGSARPTADEPSTGLGLFIAQKLARAMGGAIACESAPGEGATFTLDLPARLAHHDAPRGPL